MASTDSALELGSDSSGVTVCINDTLTDDELRSILDKIVRDKDKEIFGLVCKRWLRVQSNERKKLSARAGPHLLRKMASRFSRLLELDLSQSTSRSFYPGVTDSDLSVVANGFQYLKVLNLQYCKGSYFRLLYACSALAIMFMVVCSCVKSRFYLLILY